MIPDSNFIKRPNVPGPTKEEVRCLVICKSNVSSEDIVVDVGCGTGGLTVEFAKRAKKVVAIDLNPNAITTTHENILKHQVENRVELIEGDGLDVIEGINNFDILMVGGSSGKLPNIIEKGYRQLNNGGRIIVTSILLETCLEAINTLKSIGLIPDVVNVSIAKGEITKRGTMMYARNPIFIISTTKSI